ncbi:MAG: molybdate ABC transporter substrate-binding protein [Propionibacteriaceae bacterium]
MSISKLSAVAATVVALGLASGCDSSSEPVGQTSRSTSGSTRGGILTVFAAASLQSTFTELGAQFESAHPGTRVVFSFAGSADLVTQLQGGAPADVFASADTTIMDKAAGDDLLSGTPVDFASNTLEIAVPPDNPAGVASLADLTRSGVKVVLCAPVVPCGSAAQRVETAAAIDITPVSEESSVTDVLNKVSTGEADAGLVYLTDVKNAGATVTGVRFPESSAAVNRYPIAILAASKHADLASQFVNLVTGTQGQQVLADAGFAQS